MSLEESTNIVFTEQVERVSISQWNRLYKKPIRLNQRPYIDNSTQKCITQRKIFHWQ